MDTDHNLICRIAGSQNASLPETYRSSWGFDAYQAIAVSHYKILNSAGLPESDLPRSAARLPEFELSTTVCGISRPALLQSRYRHWYDLAGLVEEWWEGQRGERGAVEADGGSLGA